MAHEALHGQAPLASLALCPPPNHLLRLPLSLQPPWPPAPGTHHPCSSPRLLVPLPQHSTP